MSRCFICHHDEHGEDACPEPVERNRPTIGVWVESCGCTSDMEQAAYDARAEEGDRRRDDGD